MRRIGTVVALAMLGVAAHVEAADSVVAQSGKFSLSVGAGAVIPQDVNFNQTTASGGLSASAKGSFQFDAGPAVTATAGYQYNDYLRAEAEFGYASFDYNQVSLTGTVTYNGTSYNVSGSAPVKGSVDSYLGLANLMITPLGRAHRVIPVLGGGLGFAAFDDKISSIGTLATNYSRSGTDLAVQGIAGLDVKVTDKIGLGARYRYLWINSGSNGVDDFTAHVVTGNLTYHF